MNTGRVRAILPFKRLGQTALAIAITVFGVGAISAQAQKFQAPDIKTGRWLITMTASGPMGVPPGGTANLPPAVAQQITEEMRKPRTAPSCITDKDISQLRLGRSPDEENDPSDKCTLSEVRSTPTTFDFVETCKGDNPRASRVHLDILSRESFKGTVKHVSGEPRPDVQMVAKWDKAVCGPDD